MGDHTVSYTHLDVYKRQAYTYGEEWLKSLKQYLIHNLNFVREFLKEHLPEIKLVEPEGTYLLWLDFSALQLSDEALEDLICLLYTSRCV